MQPFRNTSGSSMEDDDGGDMVMVMNYTAVTCEKNISSKNLRNSLL